MSVRSAALGSIVVLGLLASGCSGSTHSARTSGHSHTASASTSSASNTSPAGPTRTARAESRSSTTIRIGSWGLAKPLGGAAAHAIPLAGDRNSLFVAAGREIERLDPATGVVLARQGAAVTGAVQAVISAAALWVPQRTGSQSQQVVRALSLQTLAPVASVALPGPPTARAVEIDAARRDRLVVAAGNMIAVVDTDTARIAHRFRVTGGSIADVAVNPAGTRLYVTLTGPGVANAQLDVLSPTSGKALRVPVPLTGGTGSGGLAASDGGVWIETGTGMTDQLDFHPVTDLIRAVGPLTSAGGGWSTGASVSRRVVWISGNTTLACADPRTGAVRASTRMPTPHGNAANLSAVTTAGGRLFAHFDADAGPHNLLLELPAPHRCWLR